MGFGTMKQGMQSLILIPLHLSSHDADTHPVCRVMQRRHREITAIGFSDTNPSQFPLITERERLLPMAQADAHQEYDQVMGRFPIQ